MFSLGRPVASSVHAEMSSGWARPRDGGSRLHRSIDIPLAEGTPLRAVDGGTVIHVDPVNNSDAGRWVAVRHRSAMVTRYLHMSEIRVELGAELARGATLGLSGNTGKSSGPHLHLQALIPEGMLDELELWVGKPKSGWEAGWNGLYPIPLEPWLPVDEYRQVVRDEAREQGIPLYRWRPPGELVVAGIALGIGLIAHLALG